MNGIDVSRFSGNINFSDVRKDGNSFVIARCGGTLGDGTTYTDAEFADNIRRARAEGLKVGAYYYSRATTTTQAKNECERIAAALNGISLDFGFWLDVEDTRPLSALKMLYDIFRYRVGMYTGAPLGIATFAAAAPYLTDIHAPLWIANYSKTLFTIQQDPRTVLHQTAGNVKAYGGTVDRNATLLS